MKIAVLATLLILITSCAPAQQENRKTVLEIGEKWQLTIGKSETYQLTLTQENILATQRAAMKRQPLFHWQVLAKTEI